MQPALRICQHGFCQHGLRGPDGKGPEGTAERVASIGYSAKAVVVEVVILEQGQNQLPTGQTQTTASVQEGASVTNTPKVHRVG